MKTFLPLFILLILGNSNYAQETSKNIPLSVGYFGQLAYQPGVKVGTQFDLKNWSSEKEASTKLKSIYVSPQIGFFVNPNINTNYLLNIDLGYQRIKTHRRKYIAWSIGLAYLVQAQVTEWNVQLNDGQKEKKREYWSWFMPSLNYEFGQAIHAKMSWYSKFSYGLKMAPSRSTSSLFFLELGLKFKVF